MWLDERPSPRHCVSLLFSPPLTGLLSSIWGCCQGTSQAVSSHSDATQTTNNTRNMHSKQQWPYRLKETQYYTFQEQVSEAGDVLKVKKNVSSKKFPFSEPRMSERGNRGGGRRSEWMTACNSSGSKSVYCRWVLSVSQLQIVGLSASLSLTRSL